MRLLIALLVCGPVTLAALTYLATVNPTRRRRNHAPPAPPWASRLGLAIVVAAGVAMTAATNAGGFLIWLACCGVGGWAIVHIFKIKKAPARKKRASSAARAAAASEDDDDDAESEADVDEVEAV